jgi:hypothetical protein
MFSKVGSYELLFGVEFRPANVAEGSTWDGHQKLLSAMKRHSALYGKRPDNACATELLLDL